MKQIIASLNDYAIMTTKLCFTILLSLCEDKIAISWIVTIFGGLKIFYKRPSIRQHGSQLALEETNSRMLVEKNTVVICDGKQVKKGSLNRLKK